MTTPITAPANTKAIVVTKTPAKAPVGIIASIKNKIIDKTSDVLSLPARMRANRISRQADSDVAILKKDAESGGNYIEPDSQNPAWRTRSLANEVRYRRGQK